MRRRVGSRFIAGLLATLIALVAVGSSVAASAPRLTGQRMLSHGSEIQVDVATACNPAGTSTIKVTLTGSATPASPTSGGFFGTYTETLTVTIGPQTGPPRGPLFPFDGPPSESLGLPTGEVTSLTAAFTITDPGSGEPRTASGTKRLTANRANWGVCLEPQSQVVGGIFGGAPLTGSFYILNAGVLSYSAAIASPEGNSSESGLAEAYLMKTFATHAGGGTATDAAHFRQGLGSTNPDPGTFGSLGTELPADPQDPVAVQPLPDVTITFSGVTAGGTTTVVQTSEAPAELPPGFMVSGSSALYEISTTAGYTPPVEVCLPYGPLPAGTTPALLHYENDTWVDVTTTYTVDPAIVCGEVESLSPFVAAAKQSQLIVSGPFAPVKAQPAVNTVKAGSTVPVKFSLGGSFGLEVLESGYPVAVGGRCGSTATSSIPATSAGTSGLQFDALTETYQFNWKTSPSLKGDCRTLVLRFTDGQELRADFRFT